jgi:hypothetical protein
MKKMNPDAFLKRLQKRLDDTGRTIKFNSLHTYKPSTVNELVLTAIQQS